MAQAFAVRLSQRRKAPAVRGSARERGYGSEIGMRPERPTHLSRMVCHNMI